MKGVNSWSGVAWNMHGQSTSVVFVEHCQFCLFFFSFPFLSCVSSSVPFRSSSFFSPDFPQSFLPSFCASFSYFLKHVFSSSFLMSLFFLRIMFGFVSLFFHFVLSAFVIWSLNFPFEKICFLRNDMLITL